MDPKKLLLHGIAFMILGFLVRANSTTRPQLLVLVAITYGALLEGIQAFVPYRVFDVLDLGANVLGAWAGSVVAQWAERKSK